MISTMDFIFKFLKGSFFVFFFLKKENNTNECNWIIKEKN